MAAPLTDAGLKINAATTIPASRVICSPLQVEQHLA
jgi:hypothetical protein